jgi:hypothetical protein
MAELEKKPDVVFSTEAQILISRYGIIEKAEKALWEDLRKILDSVAQNVDPTRFVARVNVDSQGRWGILQIAKPSWPKPYWSGVHFEVNLDQQWIVRNRLPMGLDVEDSVPRKHAVIGCLSRILETYENSGLLVQGANAVLIPNTSWRVFEGAVRLSSVSAAQLSETLHRICTLAPLVDEALFIRDGQSLWRTDFFPSAGDGWPQLLFNGSEGGQEFRPSGGCIDSPTLRVNGGRKGNHEVVDGKPTHIMLLTKTHEIRNGDELYLSCVVRSTSGCRLWFYGEGHYDLPDGTRRFPPLLHGGPWLSMDVPGRPDWQHVGIRAKVEEHRDDDFTTQGAYVFLRTQTDDADLRFNSIEFGRCRAQ